MKRSLMAVVAAATMVAFTACGRPDAEADVEPVEEVAPAPAPAPVPEPVPTDTPPPVDTLPAPPQY